MFINLIRIIVSVLFVLSGFVKLVDPIGFSYKLQEYAAPDVLNLPFLATMSLIFAIFLVILEIVFGMMLLLGYKTTFTVWSLLVLIVFFTFLTFLFGLFQQSDRLRMFWRCAAAHTLAILYQRCHLVDFDTDFVDKQETCQPDFFFQYKFFHQFCGRFSFTLDCLFRAYASAND